MCLNAAHFIERSIKSVISQSYRPIEYIIVDGDSKDGTKDIIDVYRDHIAVLISESDRGIYDAMNKGFLASTGDVIFYLNADDYFYEDRVVEKAVEAFEASDESMICYGDVLIKDGNSEYLKSHRNIDKEFLFRDTICHQAVFAKRELFDRCGYFDLEYKACADYDWLLKCIIKYRFKSHYLPSIITAYNRNGFSSVQNQAFWKEKDEIRRKYFSFFERFVFKHILPHFHIIRNKGLQGK